MKLIIISNNVMAKSPAESTADRPTDDGPRTGDDGTLRCGCGALLARYVPGGIELKCRRCKRTVVLAVEPPKT